MALSGPTGVGAAYLIKYYSAETSPADCPVALNSTVVADNKEVTDALVNGTADIAAVATNVAANLGRKTDGGIQVLAVNTLGVLYILEKGGLRPVHGRTWRARRCTPPARAPTRVCPQLSADPERRGTPARWTSSG